MTLTPDPHLNLRADIKATLVSLESTMQVGGNWRRCASIASDLALKFEQLAELEQTNEGARHRRVAPPPPPASGDEFLGPRLRAFRQAAREAGMPVPPRRQPKRPEPEPEPHHIEVTEVKREPPQLPPG